MADKFDFDLFSVALVVSIVGSCLQIMEDTLTMRRNILSRLSLNLFVTY